MLLPGNYYRRRQKKTGQTISCFTAHKTPPPKILKEFPIFAGSLLIIFLQGQKSLPSSLPASKDRAKMRFSHSERGKDGDFRFGVYMYYIPPNRTPHFCHSPNRAIRSLPGLCPIFAQRFQNFARFLLAEKLIPFQDFPVIAKQRCFNLIVLLYTTCDKKCFFNFLQPSFFIFLLASS